MTPIYIHIYTYKLYIYGIATMRYHTYIAILDAYSYTISIHLECFQQSFSLVRSSLPALLLTHLLISVPFSLASIISITSVIVIVIITTSKTATATIATRARCARGACARAARRARFPCARRARRARRPIFSLKASFYFGKVSPPNAPKGRFLN